MKYTTRHRYRILSIFGWIIKFKRLYRLGDEVWFNWMGEKQWGLGYTKPFVVKSVEIFDKELAVPPGQFVHVQDFEGRIGAFNEVWLEYN